MKYTQINGINVSKMALGTTSFYDPLTKEESFDCMDYALSQGVNLFDTARCYGSWLGPDYAQGTGERVIGEYMKTRGNRDQIVISTKGCHPPFEEMTKNRLTPKDIVEDLEGSLRDLQTDYTDLWFFHRDHPDADLYEIMKTLHEQVKLGKIRALGASNWSIARIREANRIAKENGFTPFSVSQIEWSMAHLEMKTLPDKTLVIMDESEYKEYQKGEFPVMCFTSQARGLFQKAIRAGGFEALQKKEIESGVYESDPMAASKKYDYPCNHERVDAVRQLCETLSVEPITVSNAYLTSQSFPTIPILGYSKKEQLIGSLEKPDLQLTPAQYKQILGDQIV